MRSRQQKPTKRARNIVIFLLLLVVIAGGLYWQFGRQSSGPVASSPQSQTSTNTNSPTTLRFIATGDMLPHDAVNQAARKSDGSYDYVPLFAPVSDYLKADIAYCNQEAPSAPDLSVTGYPAFNAPRAFAEGLSAIGCNMINLANNHSNDRGQTGINQTRQVWQQIQPLAYAGIASSEAEQQNISYFTVQNIRFAFLSYTICSNTTPSTSYGVNMLTRSLTDKQILEAKANADMVIVGAHWCRENSHRQEPIAEQWAQYFADKGVDAVIGTGPHWLQPVQRLPRQDGGETIVWYSLGNFLNSQLETEGLMSGIAMMDIDIATKKITNLSFLPTYMHYEWTPAQKAAEDLLARTNLRLYPLDQAAEPLSRSLLNTTVSAETDKISDILNRYTTVTILKSSDL